MTSQIKGDPFEVLIGSPANSAVLADHVKNLDWRARSAKRKGRVFGAELPEVRGQLRALFG